MKNKFMQIAAGTIFGLLIAGFTQPFVLAQESKKDSSDVSIQSNSKNSNVIGTWQTSVTPRNCQSGDPVGPAFPGILTFNLGETLSGTSTTAPAVFGYWEQSHGRRSFSFAFVSLRYNPAGAYIGTQKVWQTAQMAPNGDDFTSTGTVQFLDINGTVVGTGCASSTGTKFD